MKELYEYEGYSSDVGGVGGAIAISFMVSLFVFAIVFVVGNLLTGGDISGDKQKKQKGYIVLFVAGGVALGTLIALIVQIMKEYNESLAKEGELKKGGKQ